MARRRTLGKKRKSYRKTRNKKNNKNKKTVRKTRRMRGGGGNFFNDHTGYVVPDVDGIGNGLYRDIIDGVYDKYNVIKTPGNITFSHKVTGIDTSIKDIDSIVATKVNGIVAANAAKKAAEQAVIEAKEAEQAAIEAAEQAVIEAEQAVIEAEQAVIEAKQAHSKAEENLANAEENLANARQEVINAKVTAEKLIKARETAQA